MKLKFYFFATLLAVSVVFCGSLFALDNKADESLARGKRLFADGRYEEAMDNFIDVFVSGNSDQIAEANEYVNLIHFDRGGVVAPKQVPYDEELDKKQNYWVKSKSSQKQTITKDGNGETLKQVFVKEEEEMLAEPPSSVPEADPFGSQNKAKISSIKEETELALNEVQSEISEEVPANTMKAQEKIAQEAPVKETEEVSTNVPVDIVEESEGSPVNISEEDAEEFVILKGKANVKPAKNIISNETSFPKGSKVKLRSEQKKEEKQKRRQLIDALVAKLNADEDVQVYMRNGRVDAIDINSSALFLGRTMDKVSSPILDEVYALMILENSPAYVILPEGSYTDDVTLHAVRQAVGLNTYLINRGISPAKMSLNMGLTTQEPPEKFSNLAGISVVFDYKGKTQLKSKLKEKNLPPVLSLAVYPFKEITPSAGEVFVIDFSVMEASNRVKEWELQIVSHAADGHYYIAKQLSGDNPVSYQTFWNGRKFYFGHLLPYGKYTVVLRAKDTAGRERILKRQLVLKEGPTNEDSIIIKTESEVLKAEEFKRIKEEQEAKKAKAQKGSEQKDNLDYSQKRLWNKPSKKQVGNIEEVEETVQSSSTVITKTESTESHSSETSSSANITQEENVTGELNSYDETDDSSMGVSSEEGSNPYEI